MPASLLKYWLRDLADPIITCENYDDCIQYAEDPEKAIAIINGLPDTNRRIALFTISFLQVKIITQLCVHFFDFNSPFFL